MKQPTEVIGKQKNSNKGIVSLADKMLGLLNKFDPALVLKYNKYYIGLASNGMANNFVSFNPQKRLMKLAIKLPKSEEVTAKIEESGLNLLEYTRTGKYKINLKEKDFEENIELLEELMKMAYEYKKNG